MAKTRLPYAPEFAEPAHEDTPKSRLTPHLPPLEQGMNVSDISRARKPGQITRSNSSTPAT